MDMNTSYQRGVDYFRRMADSGTACGRVSWWSARSQWLGGLRQEASRAGATLHIRCMAGAYDISLACKQPAPSPVHIQLGHSHEVPTLFEYSDGWQQGFVAGEKQVAEIQEDGYAQLWNELRDVPAEFTLGMRHAVEEAVIPLRLVFINDPNGAIVTRLERISMEKWYEDRSR